MSYKIVDQLIDKIVLNFELTDEVKNVIKKLYSMYGKKGVYLSGDSIFMESERFSRQINVNTLEKAIAVIERGTRKENFIEKHFENKMYYNINNGKGAIYKSSKDTDIMYEHDNCIILETNDFVCNRYENGVHLYSKVEKSSKKTVTDKFGKKIHGSESSTSKVKHNLACGDMLKKVSENGQLSYYYCCNSNSSEYRSIPISSNDFERMVNYDNDIFLMLNDPLVRKFKNII